MKIYEDPLTPEAISTAFSYNKIGVDEAIDRLSKSTARGVLRAAEIAIDQSFHISRDSLDLRSATYLSEANAMLDHVLMHSKLFGKSFDDITLQAKLQKTYLPIYCKIIATGELPESEDIDSTQQSFLEQMDEAIYDWLSFKKTNKNPGKKIRKSLQQTVGTFSEIAVLSLAQREAIAMGDNSFFAMPALYSEQHCNSHGTATNGSWDVGIYSSIRLEKQPYKIQVKSRWGQIESDKPDEDDICRIYVEPELRAHENKFQHPVTILQDCAAEARSGTKIMGNPTIRLDVQAEKFHDILEQHDHYIESLGRIVVQNV